MKMSTFAAAACGVSGAGAVAARLLDMELTMKASDIMVSPVITVKPSTTIKELAGVLLTHRISGVLVIDDHDRVVGMVSEGDLIHRMEAGTERQRTWGLLGITGERTLADEYVKARGRTVADVMTRSVIPAAPDRRDCLAAGEEPHQAGADHAQRRAGGYRHPG